jgi:hypothetical protein
MAKKNLKSLIASINQNVQSAEASPLPAPPTRAPAPTTKAAPTRPPKLQEPPPIHVETTAPAEPPAPAPAESPKRTGRQAKPTSFWLFESDRTRLNELGMILYSQGIAPNNTLILRAALKLAPTDYRLADMVRDLVQQDGRSRASRAKE